jgi:hypothetical protein
MNLNLKFYRDKKILFFYLLKYDEFELEIL